MPKIFPLIHPSFYLRQYPDGYRDFIDGVKTVVNSYKNDTRILDPRLVVPQDREELFTIFRLLIQKKPELVVDFESENADIFGSEILCVTLCWNPEFSVVIPWSSDYLNKWKSSYIPWLEYTDVYDEFKKCIEAQDKIIGHNGIFDVLLLNREGIKARLCNDTMLQHYALDERNPYDEGQKKSPLGGTQGLDKVVKQFLGIEDWSTDLPLYIGVNYDKNWKNIPVDVLFSYTVKDGSYEYQLKKVQEEYLNLPENAGPKKLYENLLIPRINTEITKALRGVKMSEKNIRAAIEEMPAKINILERKMQDVGGKLFKPGSTKDRASLFFDYWKLPQIRERSTDKSVIEVFQKEFPYDPEIPDEEQDEKAVFFQNYHDYNQITKVFNTYHKNSIYLFREGRGHLISSISSTVTGREAGNIILVMPRDSRGDLYKTSKNIFQADDECFLLNTDYKAHEIRCLAVLSGDKWLTDKVNDPNFDIHTTMAQNIFSRQWADASSDGQRKEIRNRAKTCVFKLQYMGPVWEEPLLTKAGISIARSYGISKSEGKELVAKYYAPMPQVRDYIEYCIETGLKQGYLENFIGRRRRFALITPENKDGVSRQWFNFMEQSTANDVNEDTIVKEEETIEFAKPLWGVHDAITSNVKLNVTLNQLKTLINLSVQNPQILLKTKVEFYVDFSIGFEYGNLVKCGSTAESILQKLQEIRK